MSTVQCSSLIKKGFQSLKRKGSIVMVAFMLGVSNAILEEDRMVNDTREHIEQQEIIPDDEELDAINYEDVL